MTTTPPATPLNWTVRAFQPADAPGIVELVRTVYGDSYYPPALYDADEIARRNERGELISAVALDREAVVGHYALEPTESRTVAEASDAIVAPAYRHHHLMEEMRQCLRAAGERAGLTGIVGYAVTNHLFSQKAEEHFGAHPCGIALGLWPRSFHNMPEPLPQRMSFAVYFKYLRPARETVHVETDHDEILARITAQWGVAIRRPAPGSTPALGSITVQFEPDVQCATIRVQRAGLDTAAALLSARDDLIARGAEAILLDLPLAQPATSALCREMERHQFFFSGLGPAFAADGDMLVLQWLAGDLDPALVQIENPLAADLLAYVDRGRRAARG